MHTNLKSYWHKKAPPVSLTLSYCFLLQVTPFSPVGHLVAATEERLVERKISGALHWVRP